MTRKRVIVFLGSESDVEFASPINRLLDRFGIENELRLASAHKDSDRLAEMIKEYERSGDVIVYITVAGMSNALSGFVDFKTRHPVVACPHLEGHFGLVDLYSSLRMPSGVAPLVVLNPESAALAAAKIISETDPEVADRIKRFQGEMQERNREADERLRQS